MPKVKIGDKIFDMAEPSIRNKNCIVCDNSVCVFKTCCQCYCPTNRRLGFKDEKICDVCWSHFKNEDFCSNKCKGYYDRTHPISSVCPKCKFDNFCYFTNYHILYV